MSEIDEKIIAKCLYAYERELGDRLGFDPIKQGDDFKAAMGKALQTYEAAKASEQPDSDMIAWVKQWGVSDENAVGMASSIETMLDVAAKKAAGKAKGLSPYDDSPDQPDDCLRSFEKWIGMSFHQAGGNEKDSDCFRLWKAWQAAWNARPMRESVAQPMSTAPKDGSTILVFFRRHGWVSVSWDSQEDEGPKSKYAHWHVDDFKHGPYPVRGYSAEDCLGWMPLPAPLTNHIEGEEP